LRQSSLAIKPPYLHAGIVVTENKTLLPSFVLAELKNFPEINDKGVLPIRRLTRISRTKQTE
jgi:hypothetical protein